LGEQEPRTNTTFVGASFRNGRVDVMVGRKDKRRAEMGRDEKMDGDEIAAGEERAF
jgi:hypothetical protein